MANKAVLFDLDNTLYSRTDALHRFIQAQYRHRNLEQKNIPLEIWQTRFIDLDQNGKVWKDVVYAHLAQEFDLSQTPQELLHDYETSFATHVQPAQNLRTTLTALKQKGYALAVVTNGRTAFQRRTVAALNIANLIAATVISEECGLRKPDPAIFHLALQKLHAEKHQAWFVGDDPIADIKGAKEAGLRTLWVQVQQKEPPAQADGSISNLIEILKEID